MDLKVSIVHTVLRSSFPERTVEYICKLIRAFRRGASTWFAVSWCLWSKKRRLYLKLPPHEIRKD